MGRRLTTEEFIEKSNKVHGDRYDYTLVEYLNNNTKVKITCHEHGVFEQAPNNHFNGNGCPKCKNDLLSRDRVSDYKSFLEKSIKVHGNKYDYSLVIYKGVKHKVKIICKKHGVFEQSPNKHYSGQKCPKCRGLHKTTEEVINEFKYIHGDKYDYSFVNYIKNSVKVKIICEDHGVFEQTPSSHLSGQGCAMCSGNVVLGTGEFIKKSRHIHGNKYDYSLVKYKNNNTKVKIICKEHGIFKQTPSSHLTGVGCPKCGFDRLSILNRKNPTGWTAYNWENKSKTSKNFDSFKVYIIRCWNDNEEFYKIGRTFLKTRSRFRGFPYNYEILKEIIFDNARDAFNKETELKRMYKEYKYIPKIKFNGMQECFSELPPTILSSLI